MERGQWDIFGMCHGEVMELVMDVSFLRQIKR